MMSCQIENLEAHLRSPFGDQMKNPPESVPGAFLAGNDTPKV